MSERPDLHPDELLQELLDDRLHGDERAAVEAHIEQCARCRRLRQTLLNERRLLRALPTEATPEELGTLFDSVLARAVVAETTPAAGRGPRAWLLAASVAAVLLVVLGGVLLRPRLASREVVDELLALHATAAPVIAEPAPAALESRLAAALPFPIRVLDLGAMDVRLRGGGQVKVGGRPAGWMLYAGPAGERLLCVMWRGRLAALPAADATRAHGPFTFRIYRRGVRTVVAWQEGDVVCALVGEGDPEGVIALAQAKAMLPVTG